MNQIRLAPHLTTEELEHRYRRASEPHERSWWQIRWLLSRGQTGKAVAASTGYSAYWIGQIARRDNTPGPEGMRNRQHTVTRRVPTLLTSAQSAELREALKGPAPKGERWSGRVVAEWMRDRLGGRPVRYQRGGDDRQVRRARQRVPRPRQVPADPAEQKAFQKGAVRSSATLPRPPPTPPSNAGPPTSTVSGGRPG